MMRLLKTSSLAAALGAGIAFFFDRESGRRRRATTADRIARLFRTARKKAVRAGRSLGAEGHALKQKAMHMREEEKPQPDDVTLARKVETEIFRDPVVPKGSINVNAEGGVVYLRGEIERGELIDELEKAARSVQGVREVENFLHVPGEAPQMKQ